MPKPNRKTVDAFYDVFADMDPDEQMVAMKVLEQTHRISVRAAAKKVFAPDTTPTGGEAKQEMIPLREAEKFTV